MRIDRRSRALLRLHELLFVVLVLAAGGLVLAVAERYSAQSDWTQLGSRSLSAPSERLVARLEGTLPAS